MNNLIGHNQPPEMTATAKDTAAGISAWMADHPVIQSEDDAREAKVFIDRGKLCVKDLEDERNAKVKPLNEQVKTINDSYKQPRTLLERVVSELSGRITAFIQAEEERRVRIAEEKAREAERLEQAAREAEAEEQRQLANAAAGELDIDVGAITAEANTKFSAFKKAAHQAAIADRETKVKIGGGFSRSLSLRASETLLVTNAIAAIEAMGVTEDIADAIVKAARAYRKLRGELPPGVSSQVERKA